jgi:phosphatidyl-myo-inositol dimannoside synthase
MNADRMFAHRRGSWSDTRPRVLMLSPAFPPSTGGIERTAAEVAGGLTEYSLEVVAGEPTAQLGMRPPSEINVHWAPNDPPYGRRATLMLNRTAVRVGIHFRPDLVLALHIRTMPAARTLRRLIGSRTILVVHAKEMREQPRLANAAVHWADGLVTVSDFSRHLALEAGADSNRIHMIHPGVTAPSTSTLPLASRPGPPTIVTVARISEWHKGHDVALEAMRRLSERVPEARWLMVGDGSLRHELRIAAEARNLNGRVSWLGAIDDNELDRVLSAAHAFCLLSRLPEARGAGEGFGIAFVEAGAHGLPVVAGDVPGVVDAVKRDVTGLLVDPRDPDAVAAALERVLTDLTLAQRLADGGIERAQELAWPIVVDRYRALIAGVLDSEPRSEPSRQLRWVRDLVSPPRTDS